jgi:putative membrane protein
MNNQTFISILGGLSWLIIWPLIYLIITFINHLTHRWENKKDKTALDILKERYAKGEIDKIKFDEMRKDL